MDVNAEIDRRYAQILWRYNQLNKSFKKCDFIFVMCSYNFKVADCAYALFQQGMGEKIIVSGGIAHTNDLLNTGWDRPEAIIFKNRLLELGMKETDIIVEDKATNSGENIIFTKEILKQKLPKAASGLIVQKPYMERRAYATAMKQWSEIDWHVTSPAISYETYAEKYNEERLINLMVGDTARIKEYAIKGYQIPQEMPEEVEEVMQKLIQRGYDKHI